MRWYGTRRFCAARLKKVTERCERLSVTFTFSSRSTSRSGDGKKSSTILTRPISPLLYLTVGFFIDRLSFSPVTRAENPYLSVPQGKPHRHDRTLNLPEAKITLFRAAVIEVFGDDAPGIQKG